MEHHVVIVLAVVGAATCVYKLFAWSIRKESERWAKVDAEVARRIDELHK